MLKNIFLQVHGTQRVRPGEVLRGVPGGATSWQDSGRGIPEVNYDIEKSERGVQGKLSMILSITALCCPYLLR